ncbi:Rne/Rng family ribonuclease [Streptomyces sp. NPDC051940]|uniref:Rne/Rng family ribonuclease n=1 Tax=Streptomyces sp. NPDC051940 TaxID=3155675 RepID=UPI003416C9E1
MLEPIEPTDRDSGASIDDNNSPGDKLPPRRRRRAASRPAGPPVTPATKDDPVAAIPPAQEAAEAEETPAAEAAEPVAAAEAAVQAEPIAEPAAEAAPKRRSRRRATAPAGTPQTDQPVDTAATDTGEGEIRVADSADQTDQTDTTDQSDRTQADAQAEAAEAAPKRTRRRATRRASAPAGSPQSAETAAAETVVAEPAAEAPSESPAAEPEPAAEAEAAEAAPKRTRRRATRRASAPAGSPQGAEAAESVVPETPAAQPEPAAAEAPEKAEAQETPEAEPVEAAPKRTRRRATRKTAAAEPQAVETPAAEAAQPQPAAAEAPEAPQPVAEAAAEVETEDAAPKRTRRRATRKTAAPEFKQAAEPAEAPKEEETPAARPVASMSLFQAPVFTEPQFQTPQRAAAEALQEAEGRAAEEEPEEEAEEVLEAEEEQSAEAEAEAEAQDEERPSRRRRRGGRRRRRGESADAEAEERDEEDTEGEAAAESEEDRADEEEADEDEEHAGGSGSSSSSRRRRRRRRRAADSEAEPGSPDDPERTVVKIREPRSAKEVSDEVQSIKGSTRLEAKKQRRREGREQGRRRVPIITEAEFLARREAVERVMVVRENGERTQIGVLEDNVLVEHYVNKEQATSYVGNVYLGKVQNVLPSMEAAFVDIGKGRNAVLYAGEVNFEALGLSGGPRRIESALKSGQSVLVQVTKDPIGHKGARLTSQVSLPGRYLVYVPEGSMTGISRKLPDTERSRLKQILKKIVPEDAGVIVRTAAEGASEEELTRDVHRLQSQWEEIQKKAKNGNAPTLLYGEPDMTVRVVRDIFNEDFKKVIVSGDKAWETIHGYVSNVAPDLTGRLEKWTSEVDVFATYRIDEQLMKALDRKVWLPSGGSLVIDKTEAMVVVDVNTGKFTGQGGNLEETVTRNNLEAAEEIVRQLRLRDLGGIVVIDFIDMVLESNRDLVLRRLIECLGRDRTKHQVAEVTSLGLVQMTRKRVGQGLLESFSEPCVHCNGRGVIVHMDQPTAAGGGGGGAKKKGKGGKDKKDRSGPQQVHEASQAPEELDQHDGHRHETAAEVLAETAEPQRLAEPAFAPDEELYSSPAEAEAAAAAGRRGRRRVTRKASAPAGPPKAAAAEPVEITVPVAEAEAPKAEEPQVPAAVEPEPEPEKPARTRRRVTRKASAPAGPPKAADGEPVEITVPVAEPKAEEPGAEEAEQPKKRTRKAATKATAEKKTAAKKATAKKTAAKRPAKKAAKKTAAAEQDQIPTVTATTES